MNSIKKQAFTLIEMLITMVIIGIILAIVLPSVSSIMNNRSKKLYKTHMQLIEQATSLYSDKYKGELLSDNTSCFLINYTSLLNDGLIKEEEIKCEGYIILNKSGSNKSLSPNYYLGCIDKDNTKLSDIGNVPTGCKGFNGKFKMEYNLYKDSNYTIEYDGQEYVKDAYLVLNATSPYNVPISYYEYSLGLDGNWNKIESNTNLSTIDSIKNYVGNIYIRAVDQDMNISTNISIPVKMDNTGPNFTTTVTGTYLEKKITISNIKDNGINVLHENPYSFDNGKTWIKETSKKYIENTTTQVCVKDKLENVLCKEVQVKDIDRVKPTITPISDKVYINITDNKNIQDFFKITYGTKGGSVKCTVDNTNSLEFGINDVTCTAIGVNTLESSATITIAHQYNATVYCSNDRAVSGMNCVKYYSNNESKCGCSTYRSCANSACGTTNKTCENIACGVESYKSCESANCGYKTCQSKNCGPCVNRYSYATAGGSSNYCPSGYDYIGPANTSNNCRKLEGCYYQTCATAACGSKTCVDSSCGVEKYKSCQTSACGSYNNTCRTSACGCETANSCNAVENEYRTLKCESTGNNGTTGSLSGTLCKF